MTLQPRAAAPAAPAGRPTVGAAAERFARLTLARAPQTQRTYRGALERFSAWLAGHHAELYGLLPTATAQAPIEALTADAVAAYLYELEARGLSVTTIRKDRAAINRFARYLHTLRLIDATEILMVDGPRLHAALPPRDNLDAATWQRVQRLAAGREPGPRRDPATAARDGAIILLLGACGLRNEEVRQLPVAAVYQRAGGARPWLRVTGKGRREREFPLAADVVAALERWQRLRPPEVREHPLLFPRIGRARADGTRTQAAATPPTAQDAGLLSSEALRKIVAPVMHAAGVPPHQCHPHVLRHTFATLYMRRDGARVEQLQRLMGHASLTTTAQYVHVAADELEAEVGRHDRSAPVLG